MATPIGSVSVSVGVAATPSNSFLFLSVPSSYPFSSKRKLLLKPNPPRVKLNSVRSNSNGEEASLIFPGGYKRPEMKLPTIVLQVCADEVFGDISSVLSAVDSEWVGLVLLEQGSAPSNLYKAACLLKPLIRGRAFFLISERVDIASAVGAAGVVLSDQSLPTIVARASMMDSKSDSVFSPMIGRVVHTLDAAIAASNSEGADFLIYTPLIQGDHLTDSLLHINVKIPVFSPAAPSTPLSSTASGFIIKLREFKLLTAEILTQLFSVTPKAGEIKPNTLDGLPGFLNSDEINVRFLNKERRVLLEVVAVFQRAAPLMEEVSLLSDAIASLDDPFMLVTVGEFNSGKSTVINALLGGRFMKEGVVPTTNEITFLRYSEVDSGETQRCERHPDGQYICYLPAKILNKMVIVDTPGTNVILQRQQRLTEEFVPRADLLLFVISADRPLTESEVTFLRYTQQWKKRLVFVLNKADLYQNVYELEEAIMFVKENIQQLLNTEQVMLYPVSARAALEAKLSPPNFGRGHLEGVMTDSNVTLSFYEFEKFLYNLMDGSTDMGKERMKMKFETPIGIAERLLSACQTLVTQESRRAKQDLNSVEALISSVTEYTDRMESGSLSWRRQILSLVDSTQGRILKHVGSTLQLSNLDVAISFLLKGEKSYSMPATRSIQNDIIGPAVSDAQRVVGEYTTWLQENNVQEAKQFKDTFEKRWSSFIDPKVQVNLDTNRLLSEVDNLSMQALQKFKADQVSKLFDQEIREVFLGAFGGLGAAGLSASLLTSVLPTTLEDLLALGLCSAGGLLAVSNFPARRQKTINKVKIISEMVRSEVEEAMIKDLALAVGKMERYVQAIGEPYKEVAQGRLEKLLGIQDDLTWAEKQLQSLQIELQNIHLS